MNIGTWFYMMVGLAGGWVATLLGGWDAGLTTLIIFMSVDYVSGLVVAGVFKKVQRQKLGRLKAKRGGKVYAEK